MSKEVKRYYTTLAFDRPDIAANCSIQGRPATCTSYELTCVVLASDYDTLLAEREAMKRVLRDARDVIASALKASAPDWFETEEDIATHTTIKKIDAALQGAQP